MKARRPITALLIAVVVFVAFVVATRFYISQHTDMVSVVAAAEPIPPRTEIMPENLKMVEIPKGVVPDGAAPSIDIFTEEQYYTGEIGLHVGEILAKGKVDMKDNMDYSDALGLESNETLIGVETDLARSAGASIYPGSRVRALAYIPPGSGGWQGGGNEPSRAEIIFDNLKVVGVVNSEAQDANEQEQRGKIPAVLKLAVTSEQEKVLVRYQEEQGYSIWFTLLPEDYQPDGTLQDYYYRVDQGTEEELHNKSAIWQEAVDNRGHVGQSFQR